MIDFARGLHNHIGRLLSDKGWSEGDLAEATGLSRPKIQKLKNGRVRPRTSDGLRIAAALGVRIADVFGRRKHATARRQEK